MRIARIGVVSMLGLSVFGCCTKPTISLEQATTDVMAALDNVHKIRSKDYSNYLVPSDISIVFKISDEKTDDGKIGIAPTANLGPVTISSASASNESKDVYSVGNTITMNFKSVLLADTDKTAFKDIKTLQGFKDWAYFLVNGDPDHVTAGKPTPIPPAQIFNAPFNPPTK